MVRVRFDSIRVIFVIGIEKRELIETEEEIELKRIEFTRENWKESGERKKVEGTGRNQLFLYLQQLAWILFNNTARYSY